MPTTPAIIATIVAFVISGVAPAALYGLPRRRRRR